MTADHQSMAKDGRPVRLYLCDDTEPFRALMRAVLPDGHFQVVGESSDGSSVVQGVLDSSADVVLLDLAMPRSDGLTAIGELREQAPDCAIVVFSGFATDAMAQRCRDLGAHAYVEKGTPVEDVRAVICRVVRAQRVSSTSTGAWSDGLDPLRKSRNIA